VRAEIPPQTCTRHARVLIIPRSSDFHRRFALAPDDSSRSSQPPKISKTAAASHFATDRRRPTTPASTPPAKRVCRGPPASRARLKFRCACSAIHARRADRPRRARIERGQTVAHDLQRIAHVAETPQPVVGLRHIQPHELHEPQQRAHAAAADIAERAAQQRRLAIRVKRDAVRQSQPTSPRRPRSTPTLPPANPPEPARSPSPSAAPHSTPAPVSSRRLSRGKTFFPPR